MNRYINERLNSLFNNDKDKIDLWLNTYNSEFNNKPKYVDDEMLIQYLDLINRY